MRVYLEMKEKKMGLRGQGERVRGGSYRPRRGGQRRERRFERAGIVGCWCPEEISLGRLVCLLSIYIFLGMWGKSEKKRLD